MKERGLIMCNSHGAASSRLGEGLLFQSRAKALRREGKTLLAIRCTASSVTERGGPANANSVGRRWSGGRASNASLSEAAPAGRKGNLDKRGVRDQRSEVGDLTRRTKRQGRQRHFLA